MKTHQKKIQLHEKAIELIELIVHARKRKDSIYETYRNFAMFTSRQDMNKLHHRLEILDMAIERIKLKYNKIIKEICML